MIGPINKATQGRLAHENLEHAAARGVAVAASCLSGISSTFAYGAGTGVTADGTRDRGRSGSSAVDPALLLPLLALALLRRRRR
ncbi:MAG TPA: hypothetical protein VGE51_15815 [Fontimonas sp.]